MFYVKLLNINDLANGTTTNADGFAVYTYVQKYLSQQQDLILSFQDTSGISTSFLNSFIGAVIDDYGIDILKKHINFIGLTKFQLKLLNEYIQDY